MNINELVASIEGDIERDRSRIERILEKARSANRDYLTEPEEAEVNRRFDAIDGNERKLSEARKVQAEENDFDRRMANPTLTNAGKSIRDAQHRMATVTVGRNESVYRQDRDPNGAEFLLDVARGANGNARANERLNAHMQEMNAERSNTGISGDFGGLVVPDYLTDLASHVVDAKSVVANNVFTTHPMPSEGMSLEIPRQTVATSAAEQTSELTDVSTTQSSSDMLTVPVRTFAAGQVLSRQAVERGRIEPFVQSDMQVRLATSVDSALLNKATVGMVALAGANASSASDAGALLTEILTACATLEAALMGTPVDSVVMNTLTWNALSGFMTADHPLINGTAAQLSQGVIESPRYQNARARLSNGAFVYTTENLPVHTGTPNTYDILVAASSECHLWRDNVTYIRAEAPLAHELGVQLVMYQYAGFTMQRLESQDVVSSVTGVNIAFA
jgi:hypothetical protein